MSENRIVGKINIDIFRCITEDITTDEVILTKERIEHIKLHHPGHFEVIIPYLEIALKAPDYILKDSDNKNNTGLILKKINENGVRIQIVLRIHTSNDDPKFKNSIISSWKISETRWNNYLKNKVILYKYE